MSRKRFTPEQIIGMLREAEVRLSKGEKIKSICRSLEITEQTYYRWRKDYGGMKVSQAKRLKELEKENGRLKKASQMRRASPGKARDIREACVRGNRSTESHSAKGFEAQG